MNCISRRSRRPIAWLLLCLIAFVIAAVPTYAGATPASGLAFTNVWARAASEGHMSAVYMDIANAESTAFRIVSAHADVAAKTELHETTTEITFDEGKIQQVMRMEQVDALEVPPRETVKLAPGGLHIMLIQLTRDIEEGDTFTLALRLESGDELKLDVPVTVGLGEDDEGHLHSDH